MVTAGLMMALWCVTIAFVASPELHRLLHGDAQNLDHQCLITLVQQHLFLGGGQTAVVPVVSPAEFGHALLVEAPACVARDYRVSPSRAPPALFCATTVVG